MNCPAGQCLRWCRCGAPADIVHDRRGYCAACFIEVVGLDALTTTTEEQPPV